jgi:hypothetical protein
LAVVASRVLPLIPIDEGTKATVRVPRDLHPRGYVGELGIQLTTTPKGLFRLLCLAILARYGEFRGRVSIATGELVDGELPPRAARLVRNWAQLRRAALQANWRRAEQMQPLERIEPLP